MTVFGIDYAWGRPSIEAMKNAGVKYVCRYLSYDTTGKNLTRSEAENLSKAGIWIVVVWETTAARALQGRGAGVSDAKTAVVQAANMGMPSDRPIYFAVDFDATSGQQTAINAYFDGVNSVIGASRTGIYGGYYPVTRTYAAGKVKWVWQTYAWSGGKWHSECNIQQYINDKVIDGVGVDYDRALTDDYGQWKVGESFTMPLTGKDKDFIRDAVWGTAALEAARKTIWTPDKCPAPDGSNVKDNPTWRYENVGRDTWSKVNELGNKVDKLQATVDKLITMMAEE